MYVAMFQAGRWKDVVQRYKDQKLELNPSTPSECMGTEVPRVSPWAYSWSEDGGFPCPVSAKDIAEQKRRITFADLLLNPGDRSNLFVLRRDSAKECHTEGCLLLCANANDPWDLYKSRTIFYCALE